MFLAIDCSDALLTVVTIVRKVVDVIKWGVPVLLIIFGTIDLAKAVIAGKEDEMKKAQNTFIKRLVYAIAVFLVVALVEFVMDVMPENTGYDSTWADCWNKAGEK